MPRRIRSIFLWLAIIFLLPLAAYATFYTMAGGRPWHWSQTSWASTQMLPPASSMPEARVVVFTARTGAWKGIFSLHSWIVVKAANAARWTRYDVVGWGNPVRTNGWAPDGRWYGDTPRVLVDVRGTEAAALIPKITAAVEDYAWRNAGDYRIWPGPNSNTFTATVLRAVPELGVSLPPNAMGRDFRGLFYAGVTSSGTEIEAMVFGLFGFTVGWAEGIEVNVLGLVAGFDVRQPAVKLPGFGRIGFDMPALAAPAPEGLPGQARSEPS